MKLIEAHKCPPHIWSYEQFEIYDATLRPVGWRERGPIGEEVLVGTAGVVRGFIQTSKCLICGDYRI